MQGESAGGGGGRKTRNTACTLSAACRQGDQSLLLERSGAPTHPSTTEQDTPCATTSPGFLCTCTPSDAMVTNHAEAFKHHHALVMYSKRKGQRGDHRPSAPRLYLIHSVWRGGPRGTHMPSEHDQWGTVCDTWVPLLCSGVKRI
jgi:hypothetical protein